MPSNTFGRQVVIPMTNGSGGGVIAGDVVIVKTTANLSFTTTTSAGFTGMVGVAQETIANAAVGKVLLSGYAALINVNASVTRGDFGATHTVAKQAADFGAARGTGTFCQFLTGGTTPDAVVYPVDLLGSSLTNPMTTVGDIIQGTTAGAPARLAAGTAGFVLTSAGAATPLVWAAGGATVVGCRAYNNTTQTIAHATVTPVTLNTEEYDSSTLHSTASNTSRFTANATGKWRFIGGGGWASNAIGIRDLWLRVNGTTDIVGVISSLTPIATGIGHQVVWEGALTSADYIELIAFQTSGGNLAFGDTGADPKFAAAVSFTYAGA